MIQLRVLGEIRLRAEDGTELDALLRQPKRLALLAYLASPSPGTWHRRDMLLALFWPELDTAHARTSLRNGLYVLRQALGEDVLRNRGDEEISIDPGMLQTDLAVVWDALRSGRPEEALAHYGGELLPGLFPSDCEGFQRWLDSERMRLKVGVSAAAMASIDELERAGKLTQALGIARRVIEVQPEDETVVRRVMTLHEAMGDRAGGLAAFESYRSRLASDFDAEPAPETVAVASRLRVSSVTAPPRSRDARPAARKRMAIGAIAEPGEVTPGSDPELSPSRSSRRFTVISAIALAVVAITGVLGWKLTQPERPASIGRSMPLTSEDGLQVEAAISPNGRLVAYTKGHSNQLRIFVQKIGGGPAWALTDDSTEVELMPRWSPDNDQLLFLTRNNAYASPSLGGRARIVARGTEGDGMVRSASWSPSGDSIVIVRNDSLIVKPLEGAGSRFIARGTQLHSCVWSPGGKWIACTSGNWIAFVPGPLFGNDAPSAIILFSVATGKAVDLTGSEYQNSSPAWSADGKFLWLLSSRDGVVGDVYAIPIGSEGRASGSFVRAGLKAESIGLSGSRIAYSVPSRKANIWTSPVPRDSAITIADARQITSGNQVIELVSVSRDGKRLAYDSNLSGNADIYSISTQGGAAERLTDDPRPEYAAELSPNGEEIAWQRFVNGERHLFVKRLASDSAEEILPVPGDQGVPRWSPDGSSIVAWSHMKEHGAVFVLKRDGNGKWKRPAWRIEEGQLPVWSPDGRTIAYVMLDGSVQTIPADSGARRTIYAPRAGSSDPLAVFLSWKNPGTIWMMGQTAAGQGIWALSIESGRARQLVKLADPFGKSFGSSLSSDGSNFYFALDERFANIRWAELTGR